MIWRVEFDSQAEKELDRLDPQQAKRILKYLFDRIATDEDPRRFGDPLRSNLAGLWRYRVGNYRIICDIQDNILLVLALRIGHRREVYR